jgi:hypothetical protein
VDILIPTEGRVNIVQFYSHLTFDTIQVNMISQLSLVASSPLCDSLLVEIKCINASINKTIFKLLKKTTTCFGPFLGGPSSG